MMRVHGRAGEPAPLTDAVRELASRTRFELVPMSGVESAIDALAPASLVSVTCSPAKGVQATLDLTARLLDLGHDAVPHVSARLFEGPQHVRALTDWVQWHDLRELFVIAGDCEHPRGPYPDSMSFLRELLELGPSGGVAPARCGRPRSRVRAATPDSR